MSKGKNQTDRRPLSAYEPPRALRLGQAKSGKGGGAVSCRAPGSGAAGACSNGAAADPDCYQTGSSADWCTEAGSGATAVPAGQSQGNSRRRRIKASRPRGPSQSAVVAPRQSQKRPVTPLRHAGRSIDEGHVCRPR